MSLPVSPVASPIPSIAAPLSWRIVRLHCLDQLYALSSQWEGLAARALEPNVFYEPWMMLPALAQFHGRMRLEVYAVFAESSRESRLVGLIPFERRGGFPGLSSPRRRLLRYYYCSLCTPLLDGECADEALRQLFLVLRRAGGVWEFDLVHADGPVMGALQRAAANVGLADQLAHSRQRVARALLRPALSAEAYLCASFPGKKRSKLRRRERQLRELGELRYDTLAPDQSPQAWIDEFLGLEASGWKGAAGSAFARVPGGAQFFRQACLAAHDRGRLEMHALRLNGRAIAHLCLFTAAGGLYAFRTAYDETYARYAPGVLLAVWHSCQVHERPQVAWVDSCADPASAVDNELWLDRRGLAGFYFEAPAVQPFWERIGRFALRPARLRDRLLVIAAGPLHGLHGLELPLVLG